MRQIWISSKGGPEVLTLKTAPEPAPAAGEVRIRVAAAGVNFADIMMRLGLYPDAPPLPAVPGYEVAGRVDAVGEGVPAGRLDEPVVAMCRFGGYSEQVCVPAAQAYRRPETIDPLVAAALPVNYLTAYQMLRVMAPVQPGESVLIPSAAGGVGIAALQIAQLCGARVIASAAPAKHDFLRERGAEFVFDSRAQNFAALVREANGGRGVDIALEPRHGRWIMESYRALAKGGRLVLFGFSSAASGSRPGIWTVLRTLAQVPWLTLNPIRLMNDNRSLAGVNLGRMWSEQERLSGWIAQLLDWLVAGRIAPHIDRVFPFAEAGAAHQRLEQRRNVGKVLLTPDGTEPAA